MGGDILVKDLKIRGNKIVAKRRGNLLIIAPIMVFSPDALYGLTEALCFATSEKDGMALITASSWKVPPISLLPLDVWILSSSMHSCQKGHAPEIVNGYQVQAAFKSIGLDVDLFRAPRELIFIYLGSMGIYERDAAETLARYW